MRKYIQSSILSVALTVAATAAFAQSPDGGDQPRGPRPHGQFQGHQPDPQMEVKMLTRRLNLTPEQATQIEPILADSQARMKALKPAEGTQPDFKAMREQHKAIMDDTKARLSTILTPEQQAEMAKMREHRGGPGPGGKGPHGAGRPQPGTSAPTA